MLETLIAVKAIISVFDIMLALFFVFVDKKEEKTAVIAYMISSLFSLNVFLIWS